MYIQPPLVQKNRSNSRRLPLSYAPSYLRSWWFDERHQALIVSMLAFHERKRHPREDILRRGKSNVDSQLYPDTITMPFAWGRNAASPGSSLKIITREGGKLSLGGSQNQKVDKFPLQVDLIPAGPQENTMASR
jgi:hypothetical protein